MKTVNFRFFEPADLAKFQGLVNFKQMIYRYSSRVLLSIWTEIGQIYVILIKQSECASKRAKSIELVVNVSEEIGVDVINENL